MTQEEETVRVKIENIALRVALSKFTVILSHSLGANSPTAKQTLEHLGESVTKGMEDSEKLCPDGKQIFIELYNAICGQTLAPLGEPDEKLKL